MSYFRICSMRSIQKTTFCGFIALLNKVLDFGGQLADKMRFILFDKILRQNFWAEIHLSLIIICMRASFDSEISGLMVVIFMPFLPNLAVFLGISVWYLVPTYWIVVIYRFIESNLESNTEDTSESAKKFWKKF